MTPDHQCNARAFGRSVCSAPCGRAHASCSYCGKRQDHCALDRASDEKADLAASLSLDMANARAERWRVRTMEARFDANHWETEYDDACAQLEVLRSSLRDRLIAARADVAATIGAAEQFLAEDYTVEHGADAALTSVALALGINPPDMVASW